jgi:hypothetical protein
LGIRVGRNRKTRVTYGFDGILLVPGDVTINSSKIRGVNRVCFGISSKPLSTIE